MRGERVVEVRREGWKVMEMRFGGGEDERFERRNENFVDLGGVCGRTSGNKEKE